VKKAALYSDVHDLRIDRAGGGHLERRGSRRHMARQTGVKEAGFALVRNRRLSSWIWNMEVI